MSRRLPTLLATATAVAALSAGAQTFATLSESFRIAPLRGEPREVTFNVDSECGTVSREGPLFPVPVPVEDIDYLVSAKMRSDNADGIANRDAINTSLERTILENVEFKEATLWEVLRFIQRACDAQNPPEKRVTFLLSNPVWENGSWARMRFNWTPVLELEHEPTESRHRVSFASRKASAAHVLKATCEQTHLYWETARTARTIRFREPYPDGASLKKLHTVSLPPALADEDATRAPLDQPESDWRLGVLREIGAGMCARGAQYDLTSVGVILQGTPQDHEQMDRWMPLLATAPTRPWRYRLHGAPNEDGSATVFLWDTDGGRIWQYKPADDTATDPFARMERFEAVDGTSGRRW